MPLEMFQVGLLWSTRPSTQTIRDKGPSNRLNPFSLCRFSTRAPGEKGADKRRIVHISTNQKSLSTEVSVVTLTEGVCQSL